MKLNLKLRTLMMAMLSVTALIATGCDDADEAESFGGPVYLSGTAYNAADETAGPINGYTVSATVGGETFQGLVDASGNYYIGPIPYHSGYTIRFEHPNFITLESRYEGIRTFIESFKNVSTDKLISVDSDDFADETTAEEILAIFGAYDGFSFEFDMVAHLVPAPASLPTSIAFEFHDFDGDSVIDPRQITGQIRLQPTLFAPLYSANGSLDAPDSEEVDAYRNDMLGHSRTYHRNDGMKLNNSIRRAFEGGAITLTQDEGLIYGMTYTVTVMQGNLDLGLGVEVATVTAGIDRLVSINLNETVLPGIEVEFISSQERPVDRNVRSVTIIFNQEVTLESEFGGAVAPIGGNIGIDRQVTEDLDDNFSLRSTNDPNNDVDACQTVHQATPEADNPDGFGSENGVTFSLQGEVLTITWNGTFGFDCTVGGAEQLEEITFGGLGSILVRPAEDSEGAPVPLSALVGGDSLTIHYEQGR